MYMSIYLYILIYVYIYIYKNIYVSLIQDWISRMELEEKSVSTLRIMKVLEEAKEMISKTELEEKSGSMITDAVSVRAIKVLEEAKVTKRMMKEQILKTFMDINVGSREKVLANSSNLSKEETENSPADITSTDITYEEMEKIIGDLSTEKMCIMLARMVECKQNESNSSTNGVLTEEIAKRIIDIGTNGTGSGEVKESDMKLNSENILNLTAGINTSENVNVFQTDLVRTDDHVVLTDSNIVHTDTNIVQTDISKVQINTNLVHTDTDIVHTENDLVPINTNLIPINSDLVPINTNLVHRDTNLVPINTNIVPTTIKESTEDIEFHESIDNQLLSNLLEAMQFIPSSVSGPGPRFPSVLIQQYKEVILLCVYV
jgi:hypothetical protein